MEDLMALFESRGIDHVGIRYRDLPRAVAWFRNVLGLQIDHQTQTMAFVHVGDDGSHVALFQAEGDEPLRQPHHVALRVSDPAAAEAAARARGARAPYACAPAPPRTRPRPRRPRAPPDPRPRRRGRGRGPRAPPLGEQARERRRGGAVSPPVLALARVPDEIEQL